MVFENWNSKGKESWDSYFGRTGATGIPPTTWSCTANTQVFRDGEMLVRNLQNWLDETWEPPLPKTDDQVEETFEGQELEGLETIRDEMGPTEDEIIRDLGHDQSGILHLVLFPEKYQSYDQIVKYDWQSANIKNTENLNQTNFQVTVSRVADYVTGCRLKIKQSDGVNRWLLTNFKLAISGNVVMMGSLLLLHSLSTKIDPKCEIITDIMEDQTIIPLSVFELMGRSRLDLMPLQFSQVDVKITRPYYSHNPLREFDLEWCYGYYNSGIRTDNAQQRHETVCLLANMTEEKITDSQTLLVNNLHLVNTHIVVWYVMDTSEFGETQSLQPDIMYVDIECTDSNGVASQKIIEPSKIERVKVGNFVGYFIPTNHMTLAQLTNFIKQTNIQPDYGVLDTLINWSRLDSRITINWSNYHPGSKIFIEHLQLNVFRQNSGAGGLAFSA